MYIERDLTKKILNNLLLCQPSIPAYSSGSSKSRVSNIKSKFRIGSLWYNLGEIVLGYANFTGLKDRVFQSDLTETKVFMHLGIKHSPIEEIIDILNSKFQVQKMMKI